LKQKKQKTAFGPPLSSGGVRVLQDTDSREEEEELEGEDNEEEEIEEEQRSSARVVSSLSASPPSAWPSPSSAFSSSGAKTKAKATANARKTTLTVGRRVAAQVRVAARPSTLWRVLTDFEALPAIVPNLEACEVVATGAGAAATRAAPWLSSKRGAQQQQPQQRPLRIRQRASSQCRFWRLEAEALLEVTWADLPSSSSSSSSSSSFSSGSRELRFEQV
jgi:hypothetical protein